MASIRGALDMAGKCSTSLTLIVPGAYFHSPAGRGTGSDRDARLPVCMYADAIDGLEDGARPVSCPVLPGLLGCVCKRRRAAPSGVGVTAWIAAVSRMILAPAVQVPLFICATKAKCQRVFEE